MIEKEKMQDAYNVSERDFFREMAEGHSKESEELFLKLLNIITLGFT